MGQEEACPIGSLASTSDATGSEQRKMGMARILGYELLDRARDDVASSTET